MKLIFLLLISYLIFPCYTHLDPNNLENTNKYIRSWLPWWPKVEELQSRSASVEEIENSTDNSTILGDNNSTNLTFIEESSNQIDESDLQLDPIPLSPLDVMKNKPVPDLNRDGSFLSSFDNMEECSKNCSSDLRDALSMFLKDMSHIERYHRICKIYLLALECVNIEKKCHEDEQNMFEMITSGLNYMCVEQQLAFNATIKCIDDEASIVQSECEFQCQTKNIFLNWIMRSTMQNTIQKGVNGIVSAATGTRADPFAFMSPEAISEWTSAAGSSLSNPMTAESAQNGFNNFREMTNDLCRAGDCMLDCMRTKFNTRCEGSAGTLLSEVLVRPIAVSQNKLGLFGSVLGIFVPEKCSFVLDSHNLKKHRIDSTMDSELKRMYAAKLEKELSERAAQDRMLAELVPLDKNGVPLPNGIPFNEEVQETVLDFSRKSLEERIMEQNYTNLTKKSVKKEKIELNNTKNKTSEKIHEATGLNSINESSSGGNSLESKNVPDLKILKQVSEFQNETSESSGLEKEPEVSHRNGDYSEALLEKNQFNDKLKSEKLLKASETSTDAEKLEGSGLLNRNEQISESSGSGEEIGKRTNEFYEGEGSGSDEGSGLLLEGSGSENKSKKFKNGKFPLITLFE